MGAKRLEASFLNFKTNGKSEKIHYFFEKKVCIKPNNELSY